jgi:hypothetical protein
VEVAVVAAPASISSPRETAIPIGEQFCCDRCESAEYVDTTIHDGRSTRRDCGRCNRTAGFPRWHDEDVAPKGSRRYQSPGSESGGPSVPTMAEVNAWVNRAWRDEGMVVGGVDSVGGGEVANQAASTSTPATRERIPLPDNVLGPCKTCESVGRGLNPLFWQDRFGRVHCAGCMPCPSRVMFARLLMLKGEDSASRGGMWFEEAATKKNPWQKSGGKPADAVAVDAAVTGSEPLTTEDF